MARTKQTARKSVGPPGPRRPFGGKTPRFLSKPKSSNEEFEIIKSVSAADFRQAKLIEAQTTNQIIDLTNPYCFKETDLDIYDFTEFTEGDSLFDRL